MKRVTVNLADDLMVKINAFKREAEVSQSGAVRMLIGRSLGIPLARLLVDERVNETNAMLQKRLGEILGQLREELHGAVNEVTPRAMAIEEESEVVPHEEVEEEPEAAPLEGRRRGKAKARRKGRR